MLRRQLPSDRPSRSAQSQAGAIVVDHGRKTVEVYLDELKSESWWALNSCDDRWAAVNVTLQGRARNGVCAFADEESALAFIGSDRSFEEMAPLRVSIAELASVAARKQLDGIAFQVSGFRTVEFLAVKP